MIIVNKKSKISKVSKTTSSLKTTIPKAILDVMDLGEDDIINWEISIENNEKTLKIKKEEK